MCPSRFMKLRAVVFLWLLLVFVDESRGQPLFTPPVLTNVRVTLSVSQNGLATLTGGILDAEQNGFTLAVNWGDLAAVQLVQIPAGIASFSVPHQYLNDNPSAPPIKPFLINATVTDTDGVNNLDFLSALFQDLLGRPINSSEQTLYLNYLGQAGTRSGVVADVTGSTEYRQRLVGDYYEKFLQRVADPSGLTMGVNFLAAGGTDEQFIATLTGSTEYFNNRGNGSNAGFLNALYFDLLGRAIDPNSLASLTAQLNSGVTTSQVSTEVLGSAEHRNNLVTALVWRFLHRAPTSQESSSYVNLLNSGATDEQLIGILAGSNEYFNIRSGGTATARASVTLSNLPPALNGVITAFTKLGGLPRLAGQGLPSHTYTIRASSDLAGWAAIGTATTDTSGAFSFIDQSPASPVRFYRVSP